MAKTNTYWVHVAMFSSMHMHVASSFISCWPDMYITERLKEFIKKRKKRLFSCNIYKDKACVYRYSVISIKDWQTALKEALYKPYKKFSVFMELSDGSGIRITAERKS